MLSIRTLREHKAKNDVFFCYCFFSCLPNDLEGAVKQSGEAGAAFVNSGGTRAIVSASE